MKILSFLFVLGLCIFSGGQANAHTGTAGGWCGCTACNCLNNYGNCGWCVTDAAYSGAVNEMPVDIKIVNGNTILIAYQKPFLQLSHEGGLVLGTDVPLPASICTGLGVSSITINAGAYQVDFTNNPNGDIICSATIVQQ